MSQLFDPQASELLYQEVFESLEDGILVLDGETGIVVDVSPWLVRLLNSTAAQIVGTHVWDLGFFQEIAVSRETFLELRQRRRIRHNIPLPTNHGGRVDVEALIKVRVIEGRPFVLCFLRDVSETKQAMKELRRYQETLEELVAQQTIALEKARNDAAGASWLKGRSAVQVSREIRAPLRTILELSQFMLQEPRLSPEHREHLETILRCGNRLLNQWQVIFEPPSVAPPASSPQVQVLVVDDQEDNRTLLSEFLSPVGFTVRQATNGQEAVETFQSWQPHLILMDVKMPVMGGQEAIRLIRDLPLGTQVKIIAVTASTPDECGDQTPYWGADNYLQKPFLRAQLFEVIGTVLGMPLDNDRLPPAKSDAPPRPEEASLGLDFEELQTLTEVVAKTSAAVANSLLNLLSLYREASGRAHSD